jgi:hypothetical protein
MDGACSAHGGYQKAYKITVGFLMGRDHSKDLDGKIILNSILGWEGVDWTHLAQDRDRWRALLTR